MDMNNIEERNKIVFGKTFKRYTTEEELEVLYPLKVRFALNGISMDIFKDKRCLDAGCGGGRGSLLMAMGGAKEITAFDISRDNLETTERLLSGQNFSTLLYLKEGNLLDIPFENGEFDFVWCNGVIHHTGDTFKALGEICRVLKDDGLMWLYVYGKGGIYWYTVDFIRSWLCSLDPLYVIDVLDKEGYKAPKIAEFIDDWFCGVLDRYSLVELIDKLFRNKMDINREIEKGMIYDTSMRNYLFGENDLMGEGDLRFLLRKNNLFDWWEAKDDEEFIEFPESIYGNLGFKELARVPMDYDRKILSSAILQGYVRDAMNKLLPFDIDAYKKIIKSLN